MPTLPVSPSTTNMDVLIVKSSPAPVPMVIGMAESVAVKAIFPDLVINGVVIPVVNIGDVPKTNAPLPVSPVTAFSKLALDGVAKNVATFAPSPEIPVLTGNPVALVKVTLDGVPRAGVTNVGDVPNTNAPDPVASVIVFNIPSDVVVAVNADVPLPSSMPVRVEAPVPPLSTDKSVPDQLELLIVLKRARLPKPSVVL